MYKTLEINGNEYRLEFTIEASFYADCTTSLMQLLTNMDEAQSKKDLKKVFDEIANIPQVALTLFYAGLMEYHGIDGDGSVPNKATAKQLVKQLMKEHTEDELGTFDGILSMCIEQMAEDGFFKKVGLEGILEQAQPKTTRKRQPKTPQDHKSKVTKITAE